MQRRSLLTTTAALAASAVLPALAQAPSATALPVMHFWKDPNCG